MATTTTKRRPRVSDQAVLDAIDNLNQSLRKWDKSFKPYNPKAESAAWEAASKEMDTLAAWCRQHGMKKKQGQAFFNALIEGNVVERKSMLAKLKLKIKANQVKQSVYSRFGKKLPTQKMLSSGFRCGRRK